MQKKKSVIVTGISGIILLVAVLIGYSYYAGRIKESRMYQIVTPFLINHGEWGYPEDISYPAESAERLFLQGMDNYVAGEYEKAQELFINALESRPKDPALPAYLYYFLNECCYILSEVGDYELIARGLDEAEKYRPHVEDGFMQVMLLYTVSFNAAADPKPAVFIEEYLKDRERLDRETWIRLKNMAGMLEYSEGRYAKSIRHFYDVQIALEGQEITQDMEEQLNFARQYIANIYHLFSNYEDAIRLYEESVQMASEDKEHLFTTYVNLSTAYLMLGEVEKSREVVEKAEQLADEFEGEKKLEAEASINHRKASISMAQEDYEAAQDYLQQAQAEYESIMGEETMFLGGEVFILQMKCELLVKQGRYEEAEETLNAILSEQNGTDYGLQQEIYLLLKEIYHNMNNLEEEIRVSNILLEIDAEQEKSVRADYLEFATYYRDIQREREENQRLRNTNYITTSGVVVFFVIIILLVLILGFAGKRNMTDQLTGVYNRRKMEKLRSRYEHGKTPDKFGVIMLDIDYFKCYNDTHGHAAGDGVLKEVAKVLQASVRKDDWVIRYGGEEFLVILNDLDVMAAESICQRIKERIRETAIPHEASEVSDYITLSMGLCYQKNAGTESFFQMIKEADKCLYQSKEKGRNRYTVMEI